MKKTPSNKFSPEVRERAIRLVQEHRGEYSSLWTAVGSIAPKIGCTAYTLLKWVQRHEVDSGTRAGVATEERERIRNKLWGNALWSPSYFAGSCGGAPMSVIRQYIEQQQTPHYS